MKVAVLVQQSTRLERGFEVEDGEIDREYFDDGMNSWDEYALEEAVQLREKRDDVEEIVVVTLGPFFASSTVRRALSHGGDRAVRVWDDALDQDAVLDPRTKARILGSVVEDERPDLVLAGAQTDDQAFGATGVYLAESVGYEWAAVVSELAELDGESVTVVREREGGYHETTRVELPAVITVQAGINEPRYVSRRSMYGRSGGEDVAKRTFEDLDMDPGLAENNFGIAEYERPEQSVSTTYLEGNAEEAAADLVDVLDVEGVLR